MDVVAEIQRVQGQLTEVWRLLRGEMRLVQLLLAAQLVLMVVALVHFW